MRYADVEDVRPKLELDHQGMVSLEFYAFDVTQPRLVCLACEEPMDRTVQGFCCAACGYDVTHKEARHLVLIASACLNRLIAPDAATDALALAKDPAQERTEVPSWWSRLKNWFRKF